MPLAEQPHLHLAVLRKAVRDYRLEYSATTVRDVLSRSHGSKLRPLMLTDPYHALPPEIWHLLIEKVSKQCEGDDFAFHLRSRISRLFKLNSVGVVVDYSVRRPHSVILVATEAGLTVEWVRPVPAAEGEYNLQAGVIVL